MHQRAPRRQILHPHRRALRRRQLPRIIPQHRRRHHRLFAQHAKLVHRVPRHSGHLLAHQALVHARPHRLHHARRLVPDARRQLRLLKIPSGHIQQLRPIQPRRLYPELHLIFLWFLRRSIFQLQLLRSTQLIKPNNLGHRPSLPRSMNLNRKRLRNAASTHAM